MSNLSQKLLEACKTGDIDKARLVIALDVDLTARGPEYYTPLDFSILDENVDITKLILEEGPDTTGEYGTIALSCALEKGERFFEISQQIISKGADIDAQFGFNKATHLYDAVMSNSFEVVKFLISNSADVNLTDKDCNTPLESACVLDHKEIADLLIDNGANVYINLEEGMSPLHWAAKQGYVDIAQKLISRKVDVNVKDSHGNTPLHMAEQQRHEEMAELLKQNGAII